MAPDWARPGVKVKVQGEILNLVRVQGAGAWFMTPEGRQAWFPWCHAIPQNGGGFVALRDLRPCK